MNNLERIKQKMMIKPSVIMNEPVKILIGSPSNNVSFIPNDNIPNIPNIPKTEIIFEENPDFNRANILKKLKYTPALFKIYFIGRA